MKAVRYHNIRDIRLEELPVPDVVNGSVLLRTASVGICGSDIHYYNEGTTGGFQLDHPLILGHEFTAWIAEGPHKGQLVAVNPALSCGKCEFCLEGNPNLCTSLIFAGSEDADGAMREFLTWPEQALFALPENMTPQEGALLEPLGVAIHAHRLAKTLPGMDIGVFGTGTIGLLTIQMAKLGGASRIFATDRLGSRLEYAYSCGATDIILADGTEQEQILAATNNRGLDVVFEAAGDDGSAVETAVQSAKYGGTVILIGIPSEDKTNFTASAARRRGLTIKLSRRMKNTYPTAINLVSKGLVDLQSLVTHQYQIEEYQDAFETAASRKGIKVVINFPK
jgi:L-iditol 2-dehydrogenase